MNLAGLSLAVNSRASSPFIGTSLWPSRTRRHSFGLVSRTETRLFGGKTSGRKYGANGAIADTMIASTRGSTIGPPTDIEYEVEPVGVATMIPSARTRPATCPSTAISNARILETWAVWRTASFRQAGSHRLSRVHAIRIRVWTR